MIARFVPVLAGAHVHVRVFTATRPGATFQKIGDLTMRADEWADFRVLLLRGPGDVAVLHDGSINVAVAVDDEAEDAEPT